MANYNYYKSELERINTESVYPPSVKIFNGEGGNDTKHMNINEESAKVLIEWLTNNFLNKENPTKND